MGGDAVVGKCGHLSGGGKEDAFIAPTLFRSGLRSSREYTISMGKEGV